MKITWLGHACFLLEQDGYRVVTDPYTGVEGYPPLAVEAHAVFCSHGHFDHCAVDQVTRLPWEGPVPIAVREIPCFHDDRQGALRGENTVRVFTGGGVSVAHLGDLGHQLTDRQRAALGTVDAVLVPVGGVYTLDAAGALTVCRELVCGCVVPMHYRHAPYGLPNVAGVEAFLSLWPAEQVHRLSGGTLELSPGLRGVYVPVYPG